MAMCYSKILYSYKSLKDRQFTKCNSFIEFKSSIQANAKNDKEFYEAIILFSGKVLAHNFERSEVPKLEKEINRLFRTNAFNITQRLQFEEQRRRKYPQLRDPVEVEKT